MKKKEFKKTFNRVKGLSKEQLFEQEIDKAYKRIYGVNNEEWETKINQTELLVQVAEKKAKDGVYSRFKKVVNNYLL
jgi:hypothetical protein